MPPRKPVPRSQRCQERDTHTHTRAAAPSQQALAPKGADSSSCEASEDPPRLHPDSSSIDTGLSRPPSAPIKQPLLWRNRRSPHRAPARPPAPGPEGLRQRASASGRAGRLCCRWARDHKGLREPRGGRLWATGGQHEARGHTGNRRCQHGGLPQAGLCKGASCSL